MINEKESSPMRTIGIVGGMGPFAGIELMREIFEQTRASRDQEHIPVIQVSMPDRIVDRTAFLTGQTEVNPALVIGRLIGKLENAGAEIIGIPCNTSHAGRIFSVLLRELKRTASRVRLVHMIEETAAYLRTHHAGSRRVGVLSTNGTYEAGVYHDMLRLAGYEVVVAEPEFQNDYIHRSVYDPRFGIKALSSPVSEEALGLLTAAYRYFLDRDADTLILGCTEISFASRWIGGSLPLQLIDPLKILARALILAAAPDRLREASPEPALHQL